MLRILEKYRTIEVIFLLLLCVFSIPYSLVLGYLITHYIHGGQLTGIPFSIILWIFSLNIIFSKSEKRINIYRIINYSYILTLIVYILTMNIIINSISSEKLYNMYYTPQGNMGVADYIFLGITFSGIITCVFLVKRYKKSIR